MAEETKVLKEEVTTYVESLASMERFEKGVQRNPELQGEVAQALAQAKPGDQIIFHPDGIQVISNNGVKPENNKPQEATP